MTRPGGARTTTSGPGRYFANHPAVYRISLAGSGSTTLYAVWRAMRTTGARRVAWVGLALLEAAITSGMMHAHGRTLPNSQSGEQPCRPAVAATS